MISSTARHPAMPLPITTSRWGAALGGGLNFAGAFISGLLASAQTRKSRLDLVRGTRSGGFVATQVKLLGGMLHRPALGGILAWRHV
jgi:hypothetical protein